MDNQINTHCQICGRPIKANRGPIAHHGYTRPGWGWQSPSCLGAQYLPYEQSRDRIPTVIKMYTDQRKNMVRHEQELINNPPATLTGRPDYHGNFDTYERPADFNVKENEASGYRREYAYEHHRQLRDIQRDIKGISEAINYLERRYEMWPGVEE